VRKSEIARNKGSFFNVASPILLFRDKGITAMKGNKENL
jgi:hypothetical protein